MQNQQNVNEIMLYFLIITFRFLSLPILWRVQAMMKATAQGTSNQCGKLQKLLSINHTLQESQCSTGSL